MSATPQGQKQVSPQLNLNNMSFEQLQAFKDQLDGDLTSLSRSFEALRSAKNRFLDSKMTLETFKAFEAGQQILVPMTYSLYLKGEIADADNVLVDVGTGYYIKQSVPRAQEFFQKRVGQMQESIDKIAVSIDTKQKQQGNVLNVMKQKAQAMDQAQGEQQQ
eukprot:TRINITY_DN9479_c0_g1_i1.p1 TRINITY_DN9479_c0_g1~~TRINITY_DN9479_c0_g1_i1.p1  ORF type:complete len:162 (-),score=67.87 TRINITY_DN9479_c0_g1_i1:323-808(-)